MKRLVKKALNDYKQSPAYRPEDEMHWSNIYNNLISMPQDFVTELTYAMENYSDNTAEYTGEHPATIIANWKYRIGQVEWTTPQMTTFLMTLEPEVKSINFDN